MAVPNTQKPQYSLPPRSKDNSPRERLIELGSKHLEDEELLSIIIGNHRSSAQRTHALAQHILEFSGSLLTLVRKNFRELCEIHGVGPATACRILACVELCRRAQQDTTSHPPTTRSIPYLLLQEALKQWDQEGHLILACPMGETFSVASSLEQAVTLSLHSTLSDQENHTRWLAKLILEDLSFEWHILSLRPSHKLSEEEVVGGVELGRLAHTLSLAIKSVMVSSGSQYWSLHEDVYPNVDGVEQ